PLGQRAGRVVPAPLRSRRGRSIEPVVPGQEGPGDLLLRPLGARLVLVRRGWSPLPQRPEVHHVLDQRIAHDGRSALHLDRGRAAVVGPVAQPTTLPAAPAPYRAILQEGTGERVPGGDRGGGVDPRDEVRCGAMVRRCDAELILFVVPP